MLIHQSKKRQDFLEDIWGSYCPECDSRHPPNLKTFSSEKEDIIILDCPDCGFTIVIVELEKMLKDKEYPEHQAVASPSAI
ncbi:MAG: hypothetical protein GF308_13550 [Candidatus Heimdallarchaeota archaeon]|nr:hypothetical protein [Candidatus Heimdallarchaeota archaeon]